MSKRSHLARNCKLPKAKVTARIGADCLLLIFGFLGSQADWARWRRVCKSWHLASGSEQWMAQLHVVLGRADLLVMVSKLAFLRGGLRWLEVHSAMRKRVLNAMARFSGLETLKVYHSGWSSGLDCQQLACLSTLKHLELYRIKFENMAKLTSLKSLSLDVFYVGSGSGKVLLPPCLASLELCNVECDWLNAALGGLLQLESLSVSRDYGYSVLDAERLFQTLRPLPLLTSLKLFCRRKYPVKGLETMKTLSRLKHLRLDIWTPENALEVAQAVKCMTNLESLSLGFCPDDMFADLVSSLPKLCKLEIHGEEVPLYGR